MNTEEKRAYFRDYMRLRRAGEKAGYDVSALTHDELFSLAEQGLIIPSMRKAHRHLAQESEAAIVVTTPSKYTSVITKPKRVKPNSSPVSELQRALKYVISEDESITISALSNGFGVPERVLLDILKGKEVSEGVTRKLALLTQVYNQCHIDAMPLPASVRSPGDRPRSAMPIARNQWHTKIEEVSEFNRKRTIC